MSKQVDERVVSMEFDNQHFERNAKTTISTLERLKQSLNLTGASKGLEDIGAAAGKVDMGSLANGIENVHSKFSALEVMGITALANITNSAVNAGKRIATSLTIEPIKTGFQEYETQMGSVQTILANTESKGSNLDDVNRALQDLNMYADKTIYNFTQMTRNIGTFTAAGVDLEKSVSAIKGIANLAAVSGSTSQQASTAMYQLSQALAAGKVSIMDWNSVVTAGMGGEVFKNALIRTSEVMGTGAEEAIKKYGTFRESLTQGEWLTTDVLTATLEQFTMAAEEGTEEWESFKKSLMEEGYTEKQAEEILKMANTATDAATKVKTFSQLMDALKEAVGSGWSQTWQIIIGDFEESKELFSGISDTLGEFINSMSDSRNNLLRGGLSSGWKEFLNLGIEDSEGFKEALISLAKEDENFANKHGMTVDKLIEESGSFEKSLKEGWVTSDMLGEIIDKLIKKTDGLSAEQLKEMGYTKEQVEALKKLKKGIDDGSISLEEFAKKMQRSSGRENIIEGIKNIFSGLGTVLKPIGEAFSEVFDAMKPEELYDLTVKFREFTSTLKLSEKNSENLKRTFKGVFSAIEMAGKVLKIVADTTASFLTGGSVTGVLDLILSITAAIGDFFTELNGKFNTNGITGAFTGIADTLSKVIGKLAESLSGSGDILSSIGKFIADILGYIWNDITTVFTWINKNVDLSDIFAGLAGGGILVAAKKLMGVFDKFSDMMDGGILGMLFGDKSKDKEAIRFGDVLGSVKDSLDAFTSGVKILSLISIAIAIGILSNALETISKLDGVDIGKSLFSMALMFGMLMGSFKSLTKSLNMFPSKGLVGAGFSMILIAAAMKMLADAIIKLSDLSLKELAKGLIGVGGGMYELTLGLKALNAVKIPISTSVSMLFLAQSCKILGDALYKFALLSWEEIARGLVGMGGALGEFVLVLKGLGKIGGWNALGGGSALYTAVQSLDELSENLARFALLSWDEIGRGLVAMGGALGEVGVVTGALGKLAGLSGLAGGGSLVLAVESLDEIVITLKDLSTLSWEEIGRGLSAMGGALGEIGIVTGALGKLTGLSGLAGGGSLVLAVESLDEIVVTLQNLSELSWDEIGRGLVAMGGALGEVGVVTGALGKLAGLSGLAGGGSILVGVQGLGDLADALKKFGEMSWDEIGRGLSAMGGALGELALGGFLNTLSIIGSYSISNMAEPLGMLADSVKKWVDVELPPLLGMQLASIADGIMSFTFGGLGASAIAELAAPLGVMADSIKKWQDVTLPEGLSDNLKEIADGVSAFTWIFTGGYNLGNIASPLGMLADSIKKWQDVTLPEGLSDNLKGIADGISAFTWIFTGGYNLGNIIDPLGGLADSVAKWKDIVVPESLSDNLKGIAEGVKAFQWLFLGGYSLSTISTPLGELAGSVTKWKGVSIPEDLADKFGDIADAIKKFEWTFTGGYNLEQIAVPLGDMADSIKKWSGISIPEGFGDKLSSVATSIKEFSGIIGFSQLVTDISSLTTALSDLKTVDAAALSSGLNDISVSLTTFSVSSVSLTGVGDSIVTNIVTPLKNANSTLKEIGSGLIASLASGLTSDESSVTTAADSIVSKLLSKINNKKYTFTTAGKTLITQLSTGVKNSKVDVETAMTTLLNAIKTTISNYQINFVSAGSSLVDGFASGISANTWKAEAKAAAMAQAALDAAKAELNINSPSKVFRDVVGLAVPEGFAAGIDKFGYLVTNSATSMADSAIDSVKTSISNLANVVNSDIDSQPVIRPVMDLSDIRSGAGAINGLFDMVPSVGVMSNIGAINSMMGQNGVESEVVSAINKLRKDIGNMKTTSYVIDGITYDDGTNISSAVQDLVRAAKVERRI